MPFFVIGVLFVAAVLIMTVPAVLIITELWHQKIHSQQR